MSLDKNRLPDPQGYYEAQGLRLIGPQRAKWKTTRCEFHDGSDSMRINTHSGAFVCMAGCGAKGGDVLAYHMAAHGLPFIEACKDLDAWVDDGKTPAVAPRPTPLPARDALQLLASEARIVAMAAGNIAYGTTLTDNDRARLRQCANRITTIAGMFE